MGIDQPAIFRKRSDAPRRAPEIDAYGSAAREYFFITHPRSRKGTPSGEHACSQFLKKHKIPEAWIYYPWRKLLVHTVGENAYFAIRTVRNRNIITAAEQKNYRQAAVGIAGLSVGSAVLHALVASGGPKRIKIADFDVIEISNLNRLRAGLPDVGTNKTVVAARNVWELDPYADLRLFPNGVAKSNLEKFVAGKPRLALVVDEMDNIAMKIALRFLARRHRVPVLMATDNGDGIILDVERFDREPRRPLFHGLVRGLYEKSVGTLGYRDWLKLATQIVGPEYLTERMQESLLEIGKTIAGVPQLGPTASLAGAAIAFAVRRIANNQPLPSGRFTMGLEEKLVPGYNRRESVARRAKKAVRFRKRFAAAR